VTSTIAAALMLTLGLAGLVAWHGYHHRRERQAAERRRHQLIQQQLDRARTYELPRDVDEEYRRLLEMPVRPFDWEAESLGAAMERLP
jgi:hypothetical protein